MTRSGRTRRAQFTPTMRYQAVPPSEREAMPFEGPHRVSGDEG